MKMKAIYHVSLQFSGTDFNNRAQLIAAGFTAGKLAVAQIKKRQSGASKKPHAS
jgi:hypothetical protein